MGLTRRPYTSPADYEHIRRLLQHTYAHSGPPVYATVGDIDWWRWGPGASPGETYHAQLWWDEHHELAAILWPETSWGQKTRCWRGQKPSSGQHRQAHLFV